MRAAAEGDQERVAELKRQFAETDAKDERRYIELDPLGLTPREFWAALYAGVDCLEDFKKITVDDLLKVNGCAKGMVGSICRKLEAHGIRLAGPYLHELPGKGGKAL